MRRYALTALAVLSLALVGCTSPGSAGGSDAPPAVEAEPQETAPADLTGSWTQTNNEDPERYQTAEITGDAMTVTWVAPDQTALYWAGSFDAPTDAAEPYVWDSVNDTAQTENALLASSADSKPFTYEDGVISYEVSALGVTTTVRLERD